MIVWTVRGFLMQLVKEDARRKFSGKVRCVHFGHVKFNMPLFSSVSVRKLSH